MCIFSGHTVFPYSNSIVVAALDPFSQLLRTVKEAPWVPRELVHEKAVVHSKAGHALFQRSFKSALTFLSSDQLRKKARARLVSSRPTTQQNTGETFT